MSTSSINSFSGSTPSFGSDAPEGMPPAPPEGAGGCHGAAPSSSSVDGNTPPAPPTKEDLISFLMEQGMTKEEAEAKVDEMMANGFQPGFPPDQKPDVVPTTTA